MRFFTFLPSRLYASFMVSYFTIFEVFLYTKSVFKQKRQQL